jgi:hypothetical protein
MREKRRHPRVELEIKLEIYKDENYAFPLTRDCYVTNISRTGLCFVSNSLLEVGTKCYMRFDIIEGLPVSFLGEIYWQKGNRLLYSYGVKYAELGWFSQRNLNKGLVTRLKRGQKSATQSIFEYILLTLLVVLLARFLNQLPIAYTLGIFFAFLGALYFMLIIR